MQSMTSFRTWLNANPGLATQLTQILHVNASSISNAKHGKLAMPPRWIDTLVSVSKRQLSHASLLQERLQVQTALAQKRLAQTQC